MTSSRLILIFLGIIFLIIIIIFSSGRIAGVLRERFASFLPNIRPAEEVSPTPTPPILPSETSPPTPTIVYGTGTPTGEIPATGPSSLLYLILGGSLLVGLQLQKTRG